MFSILKIALFILPFILIFNFKPKIKAFFSVFTTYVSFMVLTALTTQYFHVFNFKVLFVIVCLLDLIILAYFYSKPKFFYTKQEIKEFFNTQNISIVIIFIISFIYLLLPNLFFKGDYVERNDQSFNQEKNLLVEQTIIKKEEVGKFNPYPFYSDEWVAIGYIRESIENQSLPIKNYFLNDEPRFEPLVSYFSFLSYLFLYFDLGPEHFFAVGKVFNLFIILALFFLFRTLKINKVAAVVSAVSALLILNTQYVSGLWMFIPFNMGALFFLLSMIAYLKKERVLYFALSLLSFLFYMPMLVIIVFWFLTDAENLKMVYKNYSKHAFKLFVLVLVFAIAILSAKSFFDFNFLELASSFLIRPTAYGKIFNHDIWDMFNHAFLPFLLIGFVLLFKRNKHLFSFSVFLIIFWAYYHFNQTIIGIDLPRLIMFCCWFSLVFLAIALDDLIIRYKFSKVVQNCIVLSVIILLGLGWNHYTEYIIREPKDRNNSQPIINIYYKKGDVDVFRKYENKTYIADPWKALIITALAGNNPLHTKSSYMHSEIMFFKGFVNAGCDEKTERAKKYKIDLVYSPEFNCPDFKKVEKGDDKNFLFEYVGAKE